MGASLLSARGAAACKRGFAALSFSRAHRASALQVGGFRVGTGAVGVCCGAALFSSGNWQPSSEARCVVYGLLGLP
eukprot:7920765-Alexandrium_andersonii.AAC.1